MSTTSSPVRVVEESPAYWRVVFDHPPLNVVDAAVIDGLQALLARMDDSPDLRVVVFESANPGFYLAHFDMSGQSAHVGRTAGPSGLAVPTDTFVRLTTSPVVSIAKIRGRARGIGSEFVLACDMRFESRELALLGQPEVGSGVVPGAGGAARLPLLVGRGRALEIVLGSDDIDGDTAERYGFVNRSLPDSELDAFVHGLAQRLASFDRRPIAAAKALINAVSLPSVERLLEARSAFITTLTWPETRQRLHDLVARGMQTPGDVEDHFGAHVATLGKP